MSKGDTLQNIEVMCTDIRQSYFDGVLLTIRPYGTGNKISITPYMAKEMIKCFLKHNMIPVRWMVQQVNQYCKRNKYNDQ